MAKKKKVYENKESKRRVTIEIRGYDSDGNVEGDSNEPTSLTIRNATEAEVYDFLSQKLQEKFGTPSEEEGQRSRR